MIETFTIAGPLAQLRTHQTSLAADLPAAARPVTSLTPPDPDAPTGPRPTFDVTPLERLRERPPVLPATRSDTPRATRAAPDAETSVGAVGANAGNAAPAPRTDGATPNAGVATTPLDRLV